MRITHVITRLIVGGAQENTVASVLGLRRKYHVDALLLSGPTTGPEGSLESSVSVLPSVLTIVPHLMRSVHPAKDWLAYRQLTELFRQQRPDIVHTHSGKAGILGRFAAHHAGVPIIVHTIHGPSFGPFQKELPNALFRTAERAAGRFTTHFISVANAMTRQYLAAGIGTPAQYTRVVSGFNLEPFLSARNDEKIRQQYGLAPGDFVIGKIARLFKLKGHDDLLAAAAAIVKGCPQAKFLLVGGGEWRERLGARVRQLGLANHFVFSGLVSPAEIPQFIGIMDILVHLSAREGLPRALPQALAAGKPVVSYDCDGANEVCRDGETGFLIAPGDLDQFTRRVLQLTANSSLRDGLGRRGRNLVREMFPLEKMVDDLYAIYRRLLTSKG